MPEVDLPEEGAWQLEQSPQPICRKTYMKTLIEAEPLPEGENNPARRIGREPEKAFEFAVRTREFEIELYWKRATYFWTFITIVFAGYVTMITNGMNGTIEVFIVLAVGCLLSFAWFLSNLGSKSWQKNWEAHVDLMEDYFIGPLYKTINTNKTYSVSKINQIVSFNFILIWIGLLIHQLMSNFDLNLEEFDTQYTFAIFVVLLVLGLSLFCMLFGYGRGNFDASEMQMYRRGYRQD